MEKYDWDAEPTSSLKIEEEKVRKENKGLRRRCSA